MFHRSSSSGPRSKSTTEKEERDSLQKTARYRGEKPAEIKVLGLEHLKSTFSKRSYIEMYHHGTEVIAGRLYVATGDLCLGHCNLGVLETIRAPAFELSGHRNRKVYTSRYKWRIYRVTTWCLKKVSYLGAAIYPQHVMFQWLMTWRDSRVTCGDVASRVERDFQENWS